MHCHALTSRTYVCTVEYHTKSYGLKDDLYILSSASGGQTNTTKSQLQCTLGALHSNCQTHSKPQGRPWNHYLRGARGIPKHYLHCLLGTFRALTTTRCRSTFLLCKHYTRQWTISAHRGGLGIAALDENKAQIGKKRSGRVLLRTLLGASNGHDFCDSTTSIHGRSDREGCLELRPAAPAFT